jgi:hypothetical protein
MAYTTIDDPSAHFHTQLYSSDGNTNRDITNDANAGDFKPDWLWLKNRTDSSQHMWFNSNVGMPNHLTVDLTDAEQTATNKATVFNTDGFRVQDHSQVNGSSKNYVAWQWKINGGTTSSNDDGGITSTVQVNQTAGISIVTWTGNGSQTNIGHGLGGAPDLVIIKNRSDTEGYWVGAPAAGDVGDGKYLLWHNDDALATNNTSFVNADFTSTVFDVGGSGSADNLINGSSDGMIAFCIKSVQGYSKIGSYIGNGNADGAFVYTGFKPAFLLWKRTDSATSWRVFDNKRDSDNVVKGRLFPDVADAENTSQDTLDFLSNGFKLRSTNSGGNASDGKYVYMAFAEHPFVSSKGVPVTAR